jgi:hypothetical protein
VLTLPPRDAPPPEHRRRRYRRYWLAVGPFIRLMRPTAMRALERQLGRGPLTAGRTMRA